MQHMRADADYRENQNRAQANWRARHPDYWRQYRATHPAYRERNSVLQRERNARRRPGVVANMDASQVARPLASGFYVLRPASEVTIAKMNACIVQITVLSPPDGPLAPDCKEMM
jgi:phage terminase small subunit